MGGGEARFVNAVVDIVVSPIIDSFDLLLKVGGEEIEFGVLFGEEVVKFVVEHPDDLRGFVGDDGLVLFVVEGGDCEAAAIVRIDVEIDVAKVAKAMKRVLGGILAGQLLIRIDEAPP